MSQQILLTLNDTAGNALGQYSINTAGSALHIQAVDGVYYQFTDTATGIGPEGLITERQGDNLLVSFDEGTDLIIENYFAPGQGQGALVGTQADGGLFSYPVAAAPEHVLAEEIAASQTLGAEQPALAPLGVLGAVGLIAGGIAFARDDSGKSWDNNRGQNHNNNNNTPSPNNPSNPSTPSNPGNIGTPNNPSNPNNPSTPNNPGTPNTPNPGNSTPPGNVPSPGPGTTPVPPGTGPTPGPNTPKPNNSPQANDDPARGTPGKAVTIEVLKNDSDPDGITDIDHNSVRLIDPTTNKPTGSVTVQGQGTWSVSFDQVTFTPEPGFTDNPTPMQYIFSDKAGNTSNKATITVTYGQNPPGGTNHAPTDITLSAAKVMEGKDGAEVGKLTTTDPDAGDTHTYKVSDSRFEVSADGTLKLKAGQHLDFATEKTVTLQVTTDDGHGGTYNKTFTLQVQDDPNYPPVNPPQTNHEGDVSISGNAKVGETLTAEVHDADNFDESKVSYQWLREGKEIAGANGKTYTLTADDEGHKITVKASYTDNAGHKESHDAESSVVQPQTSTNHAPTDITLSAANVMEGKDGAEVGKLTTTDPDAGDTHTYKVSDSRFEVSADGTLKLKAGQHLDFATEKTVTLQVTTDDGHGGTYNKTFTLNVQDDPNYPPVNPPQTNHEGDVSISGNAKVGETLTAEVHDADNFDESKVSYQWLREGKEIAGANGKTYTLTADDEGHKITVKASYTDNAGHKESHDAESSVVQPQTSTNHAPTDITLSAANVMEGKDGAEVGKLTTTDPDAGDTHTYKVSDSRFEVSADGTLKLKAGQHLDFATEKTVTLQVTTDDGHGGTYNKTFTLNVQDDPNYPPVNPPQTNHEGDVSISGNAKVGETLTAEVHDADNFDESKVSYQWLREGKEIAGANGKTYTLTADDEGHKITVKASYTDNAGHKESHDAESSVVQPQTSTNHAPTDITLSATNVMEGKDGAEVGKLTTTDPDAGDTHTYKVSDSRFEVSADGTLKLKAGQHLDFATEKTVTLQVMTDDGHGGTYNKTFTLNVQDDPNYPPVNPPQTNHEGDVSISGNAKVGETLTAEVHDADNFDESKVSYQWLREGKEIAGANGKTYTLTADDEGHKITVKASYTDNAGHKESHDAESSVVQPQTSTNHAPTDITLSATNVMEGKDGAEVGKLTTTDPDAGDTHTYKVSDSRFEVSADGTLKLKAGQHLDFATEKTVTLQVMTDDGHGGTYNKTFTLNVQDDPNYPPVNPPQTNHEGDVSISGNAKVGETLTAEVHDADNFDESKVSYQWLREGKEIAGANGKTYTLTADDEGHKITVKASYTDNAGHKESHDAESSVVQPQTSTNHAPTDITLSATNVMEGKDGAEVGKLTTTDPDAGDTHTYKVSDSRFEVSADGTLKLKAGQHLDFATEKTVTLQVMTDDGHGGTYNKTFTLNVQDDPNYPPVNPPQTNHEGDVSISGNAKVGETLTAEVHDADNFDESKVSYQWLREGKEIAGANGKTYTLTADDEGHKITVKASYTDNAGHKESHDAESSVVQPQTSTNHAPTDITLSATNVMEGKDGAEVGKLTTTDPDAGDTHTYKVSDSRFEVSADGTLKLKAGQHLDFATEKTVTLQVMTDDGHGGTYNKTFTLNVQDDPNYPPVNPPQTNHEGDVSISGNAKVGETLTAEVHDADNFDESKVSYQWLREGKEIAGANGKTYTLTVDDVGQKISVKATYTDNAQHNETPQSGETEAVTDGQTPPGTNHEGTVTISGNAKVGETLTAEVHDADNFDESKVSYQWLREGKEIAGANGKTYTLTVDDVGQKISVKATYTDNAQHNETPQSGETEAVTDGQTPPGTNHEGTVTISGNAKVGETLTAEVHDADNFDESKVSYQWLREGKEIAGANGKAYTLTVDDIGQKISVKATYTDNAQHNETPQSGETEAVTDGQTPPGTNHEGTVTISGNAKVGETLTAEVHDADNFDESKVSYQWLREGKEIAGANSKTYTLTADDFAERISVKASYTDNAQHKETPQSAETDRVADARWQPFPLASLEKGTGSEQGGVNITPPDEATYMHVLYKDHGSLKNISFERDAVGDPWRSLENKPLLNGVTLDTASGKVKLAPEIVDDHTEVSAIVGSGSRYSDSAAIESDSDAGASPQDEAQVSLSGDSEVVEGQNAGYTLRLSKPAEEEITVTVSIQHGTTDDSSVKQETRTITIGKNQQGVNFDVETLENDTFLPDRNYHVEITGVQGGTLNAKEKTVETTIHDNDKPPVPDMREGNEPGSVEITLVPGTNKLVVKYIDKSNQSQSITVIDSGNGTWLSAAPLPSDVFLDEQNRKLTLGAKAVLDKSEVRAHNDAYLEGEEALFIAGSENTPPSPPLHEEQPAMQHDGSAELSAETHSGHVTETVAQHYDHDGHGLYVSDGIDATAYSQLVSHSGEDLLNYLGQHSAELLAATKDSGSHELHGSAGDDVLVAGHGTQLLEGGAGADTFALLFDSNDAASWHETGKILDFNPQEGDRIVLAGDEHLAHAKLAVSSDADGQHLHISDDAGHTRTIDIASQNDKTPTAGDILSHVEIRTPQGYSEPVYSTPQTPHLPQDDYSHLL